MSPFFLIAEQLERDGLAVVQDFLTSVEVDALRADLAALQERSLLTRAGVGQGGDHQILDAVRSDLVFWTEQSAPTTAAQAALSTRLEGLRESLNRALYLGLRTFSGHYAVYPPGGFYKRHLDCFQNDTSRKISVIFYLNSDWKESDGGVLRVYHRPGHGSDFTDVPPRGGTLVCFLSAEKEHEVLPSYSTRQSFTGWFQ